jgi:hypothetical protein
MSKEENINSTSREQKILFPTQRSYRTETHNKSGIPYRYPSYTITSYQYGYANTSEAIDDTQKEYIMLICLNILYDEE